jgi:uncharacterized protein (TIGR00369 family)
MDAVSEALGLCRRKEDGRLILGMRILPRHCNGASICYGGVLSTFADVQLACSVGFATRKGALTVSLSLDFLEAVPVGSWIEARAEILRLGGQLAFAQCLIVVDGRPAVRADGSFHLLRRREVAPNEGLDMGAGRATRQT